MTNIFEQIKKFYFSVWPSLKEESWQDIETRLVVKQHKRGSHILIPGQVNNDVSFINTGLVRSYYQVKGKETIINFYDRGACFSNYQSFLSRKPSQMYIDALEDTEVVNIEYDVLQHAYRNHSEGERMGRLMAEQVFLNLSVKTASLLLETPEQRYLNFINEKPGFLQRVPQYMVASYLGITPEALSRIRGRLNKKHQQAGS